MTTDRHQFSAPEPLSDEARKILAGGRDEMIKDATGSYPLGEKEPYLSDVVVEKPITPENEALLRAVEIYLKCDQYAGDCPDDCKLLRRRMSEWAICAHLQQAGELMLKREQGK